MEQDFNLVACRTEDLLCKDKWIGYPYQVQAVCIPKFMHIFNLCKNPLQIN